MAKLAVYGAFFSSRFVDLEQMHEAPIILIVEDCPVTALLFERIALTQLPTCRPLWARNLQEARLRVNGLPVALFVLDVNLPDGSGLDFLWEMSTVQPNAQAIVITADPLPEYQAQSAALGALRFVEKPVSAPAILNMLREALSFSTTDATRAFRASLMNLTPFDIVQLKCLASATTALEFSSGGLVGQLYFRNGNIIHAESGSARGVSAFQRILTWHTGTAREFPLDSSVTPTIDQPWQSLIMQVAQAVDEQEQEPEVEGRALLEKSPRAASSGHDAAQN